MFSTIKSCLLDSLAPTPERYKRARELYHKDKFTHALVLLAKYRNPQSQRFLPLVNKYKPNQKEFFGYDVDE